MTKRKNEFGVKCLSMYPAFKIVDPATQAGLQLKATVEFFPDALLPEFVDAQNAIRQNLENKKMAVEAAADALIDFFNEYKPKAVRVRVDVINNNMFFPVAVVAESGFVESAEADEIRAGKKKQGKKISPKPDDNADNDNVDDDDNEQEKTDGEDGEETSEEDGA